MQIRQFDVKSVILSHFVLKQQLKLEYFYSSCEKSKTVSFASSIMKHVVAVELDFQ